MSAPDWRYRPRRGLHCLNPDCPHGHPAIDDDTPPAITLRWVHDHGGSRDLCAVDLCGWDCARAWTEKWAPDRRAAAAATLAGDAAATAGERA